jgi:uncharacterized Tic20 family protein
MKNANIDLNGKDKDKDKTVAALAHILGFLTGIVGPAIIYLVSDNEFAKRNAARSITWQIFFTIFLMLSIFLAFAFIGILMIPLVAIADLVFSVIATIKASDGEEWKYPLTTDLILDSESNKYDSSKNQTRGMRNDYEPENRIDELKQMYLKGEISENEFEKLVDANLEKEHDEDLNLSYEK